MVWLYRRPAWPMFSMLWCQLHLLWIQPENRTCSCYYRGKGCLWWGFIWCKERREQLQHMPAVGRKCRDLRVAPQHSTATFHPSFNCSHDSSFRRHPCIGPEALTCWSQHVITTIDAGSPHRSCCCWAKRHAHCRQLWSFVLLFYIDNFPWEPVR